MKKAIVSVIKLVLVTVIFYFLVSSGKLNFELLKLYWAHLGVLFTTVASLVFVIVPLTLRWWLILQTGQVAKEWGAFQGVTEQVDSG